MEYMIVLCMERDAEINARQEEIEHYNQLRRRRWRDSNTLRQLLWRRHQRHQLSCKEPCSRSSLVVS